MPKATITKAAIGRALDAWLARSNDCGPVEIKPDGTIMIHPRGVIEAQPTIDTTPSQPAPKEW